MATITKTASGTWKALVRKTGFPPQIKTFRLQRDASDWARRVEDEIVRGAYVVRATAEKTTLRHALQRYLDEVSPTKKTGARREATTANALSSALGAYSLVAITPDIVADYRDKRLATRSAKTGRTLSANSVRLELALLSHVFTVAIQEWRVGLVANPVANIRKPRPPKGRDYRITAAEEARLLQECASSTNPFLKQIVVVGIETGMRKGEITNLRSQHVNLETRVAYLPDTKNGSARAVPLTQRAAAALRDAMQTPLPRLADCDLIFFGETGRPICFEEAWERARNEAGLGHLHFHDLRHEAVSRLVEAGLSDQEVSAISGHKSMQMLKRYTHLRAEDLVAKLDRVSKRVESAAALGVDDEANSGQVLMRVNV
jgi:integrase